MCLLGAQNYKMYCSLNNIPIDESIAESSEDTAGDAMDVEMNVDADDATEEEGGGDGIVDEDEDEDMPTFFKESAQAAKDAKTPSRNPKSRIALAVRAKINKVLEGTKLGEKRARQCDQNDFLKLLLGRSKPTCHQISDG